MKKNIDKGFSFYGVSLNGGLTVKKFETKMLEDFILKKIFCSILFQSSFSALLNNSFTSSIEIPVKMFSNKSDIK
ncbi:hypothetical protein BpHYR1_039276 [Brachionus plicatilis]|uniref:Uncharacterized protein n=1 Tax=Brachionus plicatilis TaxID=10195 RepID=A0A3M7PTF6_BRAPC|nr:hypothetical protein BpHYR1_039276 [Brachionus plicatilis]